MTNQVKTVLLLGVLSAGLVAFGREIRRTRSAASLSTSAPSFASREPSSIASTSRCVAIAGTSSLFFPERMFTTPDGTSLVPTTSPKRSTGIGVFSGPIATTVFPETMAAATRDTSGRSDGASGQITPTTPVGSGVEKLK